MNKYYAVIDTNVVVSALLKMNSIPGTMVELVFTGKIVPIYNNQIITEYEEVLRRPKFGIYEYEIENIVKGIKDYGIELSGKPVDDYFVDPKDIVFYEVTMKAREEFDAKLVTGNIKHFPEKRYVLTPRQMIDMIANEM
ncbi:conserved hypothetical protein TIGR00305 [Butyrivibrio fibrisolvens 16/4]|nr:conserved hypothetical protein TIGR00305 [Butyrivibrio fibrisolvens 16/4]